MRLARIIFLLAGIWGVLIVAPEYAAEIRYGVQYPPPITHPEFFYGFIGVCLVCQILFLFIAANPRRYRPLMLLAIAEKLSFTLPCILLSLQGRIPLLVLAFSLTDLLWAALFIWAFLSSRKMPEAAPMQKAT